MSSLRSTSMTSTPPSRSTPACFPRNRPSGGPGYVNFALSDPALKLVLIENPGRGGSVNHLGVEVASSGEVIEATRRLAEAGLPTEVEHGTSCCC